MEGSLVAYKVFTNGSVLNASEINDNLMNQSVMVFSNSTARGAALTSPVAGMVTFLEDTSSYESYDGTSWIGFGGGSGVLQVVSTPKTDTYTMSSTTFADITGLSATITPSSATSKILVMLDLKLTASASVAAGVNVRLRRGSTDIYLGDTAGSRIRTSIMGATTTQDFTIFQGSANFLDSPATTSATTYSVRIASSNASGAVYVNRSFGDQDQAVRSRTASSITLMEVAG
jgi:hypothetical protein